MQWLLMSTFIPLLLQHLEYFIVTQITEIKSISANSSVGFCHSTDLQL